MNQFRRFMYGRYGFDQYTRAIIIVALTVSLVASFTHNGLLLLISYLPVIFAIYRTLSKNIQKRTQENLAYCSMTRAIGNKAKNFWLTLVGTKTHRYYRCRKCKQMIRVPRGKGKINISCPKCKTEFVRRT